MRRLTALSKFVNPTLGVVLIAACEFAGDRSLGTTLEVPTSVSSANTQPKTGSTGGSSPIDTQQGEGGAIELETVPKLPACTLQHQATDCGEDEFCDVGTSGCASRGVCHKRPTDCPRLSEIRTICGCDGQFHDSLCEAQRQGIAGSSLDVCEPVACLQAEDCAQFASGCLDLFGVPANGVECVKSRCECSASTILL